MNKRKKSSGGQAIVMVTLALISMSGMMGLAVDLGWSFFTQKAAQAAADDAALSAVQRGYRSILAGGGVVTAFTACDTSNVKCAATPVSCDPSNAGLWNLQSGCLYAKNDGFVPGGHNGRQNVLIEANIPSVALPDSIPTPPGPPRDMVYWVTVRTYERIPQLFSFVNGKQNGEIAAVATAAVASKVVPGSFWGMNQSGDCMFNGGSAALGFTYVNCGADINVMGMGSGSSCGAGLPSAYLCAPSGVILSSTCANNAQAGCNGNVTSNPASTGADYAGNQGKVYGGPAIEIAAAHAADGLTAVPTPTVAGNPTDPFANKPQPPLVTPNSPISSCGYPNGAVPNSTSRLGPFQYYSYTTVPVGGVPTKIPNALPLTLPSGGITFDSTLTDSTGCAGGVFTPGASQTSNFPAYIFYGGLNVTGTGSNPVVTMGRGQYIFAGNQPGQNTVNGGSGGSDNVIAAKNITFTGAGSSSSATDAGSMMILTDGKYPGLSTQLAGIPNSVCTIATCGAGNISKIDPAQIDVATGENWLVQGSVSTKGANWTMDGYNKNNTSSPLTNLEPYSGVLVWQDRRNSVDILDPATGNVIACYVHCGSNTPTAAQYKANNVTAGSPGLSMSDGSGTMVMKGAIYQPRGAWYQLYPGGTGVGNSPLQILTGMLNCGSGTGGAGCGTTAVTLLGPSNPIITYLPVLIQ